MNDAYYVITHTDLDGTGCEIVARQLYDNPVIFRSEADQSLVDEAVRKAMFERRSYSGGFIVIADVCPSERMLEELDADGNVLLYDHHATVAGRCYRYPWAVIDQSRSAARLMYEEECRRLSRMTEVETSAFVIAVDAYDRWQLASPNRLVGESLNLLHRFIGCERMVRRGPRAGLDDRERWAIECLREKIARDTERVIRAAKRGIDEKGNAFVAVIANIPTSDISDAMLQAFPDVDYLLVLDPLYNSVSLRSRNPTFDVSAIAKNRGGGGHVQAAGHTVPVDVFKLVGGKPA